MTKSKTNRPSTPTALAKRIARVRDGRSQRQFAFDLGVFQQNINRYEFGTTPNYWFLVTLATKERINLNWLILGEGKMRRPRGKK